MTEQRKQWDKSNEQLVEEYVERRRDLHATTRNPLFALEAIQALDWLARPGHEPEEPLNSDVVIPAWCWTVLAAFSGALIALAEGRDVRREFGLWEIGAGEKRPTLPCDAAMALVPQTLGLTRRGYAFKDYRSIFDSIGVFEEFDLLRKAGHRYTEAMRAVAQARPAREFECRSERHALNFWASHIERLLTLMAENVATFRTS